MGIVYLAEQVEPVQREVALKLIRPGMNSREVLGRFEAERQALALMHHSSIAAVFDAGFAPDGRPFFVMEYVPGVPITEYCDQRRLSTRARLELTVQICSGVQHAHQKGIIHRDLKPSNVLVIEQDGAPLAKIIDFGVAKAITQRLTERTLFTELGILVGTPEYMSPEQAGLQDSEVDARSDIYSLGVILYEFLIGALPFDPETLRRAGYDEIRRIIREDDPPRPSIRLSTMGVTAREVATRRQTDLSSLRRELHGDLDWVTMKAMEKDPARRYQSASELAADLERHLRDEPVVARPVGAFYRARKFVRRHTAFVAGTAAVAVALMGGLFVSTTQYLRAESARKLATRHECLASLNAASAVLRFGDGARAREHLFRCPPDLRGWEWRHLYTRSDTTVGRLSGPTNPRQYGEPARHVAFSSDGSLLIQAHRNGVLFWDIGSRQRRGGALARGRVVGVSGNGRLIASKQLAEPHTVQIVDTASGSVVHKLRGQSTLVTAAAFSPDNSRVAWWSEGNQTMEVWDLHSGTRLAVLTGRDSGVGQLAFDSTGNLIVSSSSRGLVSLWSVRERALLRVLEDSESPNAVAFAPDGSRVAAAFQLGAVRIWDVRSGTQTAQLMGHEGPVDGVAFSDDGRFVGTAGWADKTVRIWNPDSGRLLTTLSSLASQPLVSVSFSPDNRYVASQDLAGEISIWETGAFGGTMLTSNEDGFRVFAMSPDGKKFVFGGRDLVIRNSATGQLLQQWSVPEPRGVRSVCFLGNDRVAARSGDYLRLWDTSEGLLNTIDTRQIEPDMSGWAVVCSPSGKYIAVLLGSLQQVLKFAVLETPSLRPLWQTEAAAVAFSPVGDLLATAQAKLEATLQLHETASGKSVSSLSSGHSTLFKIAFSKDGRRIAAVGDGDNFELWEGDVMSGSLTMRSSQKTRSWPAGDIVFSPDGDRLATATLSGEIRLWDGQTFEPLVTLSGYQAITNVVFSPDGSRLYVHENSSSFVKILDTGSAANDAAADEVLWPRLSRHMLVDEIKNDIDHDRSLSPSSRQAALRRLEHLTDSLETQYGRILMPMYFDPVPTEEAVHRSLSYLEQKVGRDPYDVPALLDFAVTCIRAHRYEKALDLFRQYSVLDGGESRAELAGMAIASYHLGRRVEARALLTRAQQPADNKYWWIDDQLARALLSEAESLLGGSTSPSR